jgi:predicted acetyltransferase
MRDRDAAVAFLYPFDPRFYRTFGYETIIERKQFAMEAARLPSPAGEGRAAPAGEEWAGRLLEAYREFMAPYECRVIRDLETMARRLREHEAEYGNGLVWLRGARVCGYLLGHREADAFVADEWAARDADALPVCWPTARPADRRKSGGSDRGTTVSRWTDSRAAFRSSPLR